MLPLSCIHADITSISALLSGEVERVRSLGLACEPIAAEIEAREMDDWKGNNPLKAIELAMKTFGDRSEPEVNDLQSAILQSGADKLVIDTNSWGHRRPLKLQVFPGQFFSPISPIFQSGEYRLSSRDCPS